MTIEYKVGTIQFDPKTPPQKYIIAKSEGSLVYHARTRYGLKSEIMHKEIARQAGLAVEDVVGGGAVAFRDGVGWLREKSADFGGVPLEILQKFTSILLPEYQKFIPELASIDVLDFGVDLADWLKLHDLSQ